MRVAVSTKAADGRRATESQRNQSLLAPFAPTSVGSLFGSLLVGSLGGLLKKALTERAEKTELRRTLIEVERNGAELRRVIAHLVRSR